MLLTTDFQDLRDIYLNTELTEICRRPTDHREVINEKNINVSINVPINVIINVI